MSPTNVDAYLRDGCGRCEHYQTPSCKVHRWSEVLRVLLDIARASGLTEEIKWGNPCYSLGGKNVVMIASFKEYCGLSFFKGVGLADEAGLLESPGPSSRTMRMLRFRSETDLITRRKHAEHFVAAAVALERSGKEVKREAPSEPVPAELAERLAADAELRRAFDALTPGRRRSHVLYVGGAKESATRVRRVERCAEAILAGHGFNER